MSAPWEVFVAYQITAPKEDGLAMPQDTFLGPNPNVRYLRADLTCGECAKYDHWTGTGGHCPHSAPHFAKKKTAYARLSSDPACMAFTPRQTERIECGEE